MAAEAPVAPLVGVDAGTAGAIAAAFCDLKASICWRRRRVMCCWSSRAAAEVKVKVWLPAGVDRSGTTILMEALADVAGVCWRSGQRVNQGTVGFLGPVREHTCNVANRYRQRRRSGARGRPRDLTAIRSDRDSTILLLVLRKCVGHAGGGAMRPCMAWVCSLQAV